MSAEGSRDAGTNKTYEFVFGTPTSVMLKSSDTTRSKTLDLCDLFSESCVEDCGADFDWASISVEFKPTGHSWDYSWRSNRWSGKLETHVVEVAVLKKIGERLESMGSESCPAFQVISSSGRFHGHTTATTPSGERTA